MTWKKDDYPVDIKVKDIPLTTQQTKGKNDKICSFCIN
jgi:hypothetical protein